MTRLLIRWVAMTLALYLTVYIGQSLGIGLKVTDYLMLFVAVVALGFANSVIAPIVKNAACVLNCLTLGLLGLLINAVLFYAVGQLQLGYQVTSVVGALFGSIVSGVLGALLNNFVPDDDKGR